MAIQVGYHVYTSNLVYGCMWSCKGLRKKRAALTGRTTTLSSALRDAKEEAEQIQDQVYILFGDSRNVLIYELHYAMPVLCARISFI